MASVNDLNSYLNDINKIINSHTSQSMSMLVREYNKAVIEVSKEAQKMYDSFIDQYYKYETKSYYRHEVGKGTGTGWNLYLGQDIRTEYSSEDGVKIKDIIYDFSAKDMKGYKTSIKGGGYKEVDPKEVLDLVMYGIRGIPQDGHWWTTWEGSYSSKMFSYSGTMRGAFDKFISETEIMVCDVCRPIFQEKYSKIKEKKMNELREIFDKMYQTIVDILKK